MVAGIFRPLGETGASLVDDTTTWQDKRGYRLSDRIWRARQADRDAINGVLQQAVANGDDPLQAAKRLEDYLTPVGRQTRTQTPRSGVGNYAARRLARTEVSRAFNEASARAAAANPFVRGVQWNLSGRHGEPDICDERASQSSRGMPPGVYRHGDKPRMPSHPHCLCFWTPYTVDDTDAVVRGLRRDAGSPVEQRSERWQGLATLWRAAKALLGREAA